MCIHSPSACESHSRAFISLGLIFAVLVIAILAGGGAWYAANQSAGPSLPMEATSTTEPARPSVRDNRIFWAEPFTGHAPLSVHYFISDGSGLSGVHSIDFGDGWSTPVSLCSGTCPSSAQLAPSHRYMSPGTYVASLRSERWGVISTTSITVDDSEGVSDRRADPYFGGGSVSDQGGLVIDIGVRQPDRKGEITLTGWALHSIITGATHIFGQVTGGSLKHDITLSAQGEGGISIWTARTGTDSGTEGNEYKVFLGSDPIWNQTHDVLQLIDPNGRVVDTYTYSY